MDNKTIENQLNNSSANPVQNLVDSFLSNPAPISLNVTITNEKQSEEKKSKNENNVQKLSRSFERISDVKAEIAYTPSKSFLGCKNDIVHCLTNHSTTEILLGGETAVGKTSVITSITYDIHNHAVPKKLWDSTIISLSLRNLIDIPHEKDFYDALHLRLTALTSENVNKVIVVVDNFEYVPMECRKKYLTIWNNFWMSHKDKFELLNIIFVYSLTPIERKIPKDKPSMFDLTDFMDTLPWFESVLKINYFRDLTISQVLRPRIDELEKQYNVTISSTMREYAWITSSTRSDYSQYLKVIENLLSIASTHDCASVDKSHIKELFFHANHMNNCREPNMLRKTAYHEAGHALMHLYFEEYSYISGISIFVNSAAHGVTYCNYYNYNAETLSEIYIRMMSLLGGIIVETNGLHVKTKGPTSDLSRVRNMAKDYILKSGDSDFMYENYSLYGENCMSEAMLTKLEEAINKFIKKATKKAIKIYNKHKDFIIMLGNTLYKKEFMTSDEIYEIWDKHLRNLNETKKAKKKKKK